MVKKQYDKEDIALANLYLSFTLARAKGEVMTGASYIRELVLNHPEYKKDSLVTPRMAYDLISNIIGLGNSMEQRQQFLGKEWA